MVKATRGFAFSLCFTRTSLRIQSFSIAHRRSRSSVFYSLRASSPPIWVSEVSLARTRDRGGRGKESLQRSLINFHFHPGNPGTPQSVKTVTANVPQIRKVLRQPRTRRIIYLFINRFRNSIKAMFLCFFFSTETSNFNLSARIRTH